MLYAGTNPSSHLGESLDVLNWIYYTYIVYIKFLETLGLGKSVGNSIVYQR